MFQTSSAKLKSGYINIIFVPFNQFKLRVEVFPSLHIVQNGVGNRAAKPAIMELSDHVIEKLIFLSLCGLPI
ncbi:MULTISPECIES: hypothetical protein, partial [unclassified Akkermansia]|uniref:hypothetical protein n=1 Tax=unclassified Akkermansia TaxID=2608915 RepID=UPI0025B831A1